ncbi:L-serine ammonia-lyase, iron-sulfur-dependent subunit beta [Peptoniphilus stercorisuis]|uniref:L-serine deaminase n=1 Tax=Peptoniphilus stercorisuis TaxID=1436965 RepID=A0ABS4KF47_9FIRM|nr:L-serine ammonia-lyase, iron-sulfur-dependent subunit beta [Peptoniphilus stercorisuis]MBP2025801.1 L-serine dehydratase [Peptoniphilus stercorisuis]
MAEYSAFDVLGPIMIGPSSSHTAGACRIARTALKICGNDFKSVDFLLHGSFALTYKGHGTDKALIGGILNFDTDDERIRDSFNIAKEKGIEYSFKTTDLGEKYHPNTVKIVFHYENKPDEYVIGTSIGGGAITIVNIDGMEIDFRGEFPTILLQYDEQKGAVAYVSSLLAGNNYNIESINTKKDKLKNIVTLTVEIDRELSDNLKDAILKADRFNITKYMGV